MLTLKDVVAINQTFHDGKFANKSSLEFALAYARKTTNWTKGLAYLVRAVLIGHVFEDGNKRTAAGAVIVEAYAHGYRVDKDALVTLVERALRKNTTSIREFEEMIKDAIR